MKNKNKIFLGAAAVTLLYSVVNGKGPFNKPRFKEQHDAISRYVDSHYPNAVYSPIISTGNGWSTVITRPGMNKIMLYASRTENGNYVFHETEAQ